MAQAAILSQVEGLLEQFQEDYPEDAEQVSGLLNEVTSLKNEWQSGGEEGEVENPEDEDGPPAFKSFKDAQIAALDKQKRDGQFMRGKKAKASDEEEEQPEDSDEETRKKKRAKASPF